MVNVSVDIDQAAVTKLTGLLTRIETAMPQRAAAEIRRAAIYICKSLAARTPVAPKRVRPSEYRANVSPVPPRYITTPRGLLRRWELTRKLGTPAQYTRNHYVYTKARRGKDGRMVGKRPAQEMRELLLHHGGISRRGIAKKSWGWIAQKIYNGSGFGDLTYRRTKGERRDPRAAAQGQYIDNRTSASAAISNMLYYIGTIVPPSKVSEAFTAAVNRFEHNVSKQFDRMAAK